MNGYIGWSGWVDEWIDGWINGWMDRSIDKQIVTISINLFLKQHSLPINSLVKDKINTISTITEKLFRS